jgi:hypothetical protein
MDNIQKIRPEKVFLAIGIAATFAIFLTNPVVSSAYAIFGWGISGPDCVIDENNYEVCCDYADDGKTVVCTGCDVDIETGEKSNCKNEPVESETSSGDRNTVNQEIGQSSDQNSLPEKDPECKQTNTGSLRSQICDTNLANSGIKTDSNANSESKTKADITNQISRQTFDNDAGTLSNNAQNDLSSVSDIDFTSNNEIQEFKEEPDSNNTD